MGVFRWLARLGLALVSLLAGCWWGGTWRGMYGIEPAYGIPTPPHDPTVTIEDFSYTPVSPVGRDAKLVLRLKTNKPTDAASARARIGDPQVSDIWLNDYGDAPDEVARDGVWTGEWQLTSEVEPGTYPVIAKLSWFDGFAPLETSGEDLQITGEGD